MAIITPVGEHSTFEFKIFNPGSNFECVHQDGYVSTTEGINSCCGGKHEYLIRKNNDYLHVNILDDNHALLIKANGEIGVKEIAI